jgi:uncharacterized membrane protein
LVCIFCVAYPIAVIGVAFDVHPPFSLSWAGSILLFLEGVLLILAAMLLFGWKRGLLAGLLVILLSYIVETTGVNTGFPFGLYHYTQVLFPRLPGGVPLAVMFAWALIIFGSYSWIAPTTTQRYLSLRSLLPGGLLAMLLDLEIEPVATYLEHYWQWFAPGHVNYYGVPLANFAAWFVTACVLLFLVHRVLVGSSQGNAYAAHPSTTPDGLSPDQSIQAHSMDQPLPPRAWHHIKALFSSHTTQLAALAPRTLFALSLFMFGVVDLTHGYYLALLPGLLAGGILYVLSPFPRRARFTIAPAHRIQQNKALQDDRDGMQQAEHQHQDAL